MSQSHANTAGPTSNSQSAIATRASAVLSEYMSLKELADELEVNKRTLDRWHASRTGPPRTYVSRRPMYRREAVLQWLRKINSEYEELARFGKLFPAPDKIDRERLRVILVAAGVPVMLVGEEVVDGAASSLYDAWVRYRAYKQRTAGPSRELRQLNRSLMRWLEKYTNNDLEGYLLRDKRDALVQLANETQMVSGFLEHLKPRGKKENPKTTFLTDIYYLYIAVGGKVGLSDEGPAHCFVAKCSELVDPKMLIPKTGFRQLIQAAIKRRDKRGGHPHDF